MIEALYIHIPFCVSRCSYCDFSTQACSDDSIMDAYVDALSLQIRRASKAGLLGDVKTIYIGGGTPTHLGTRRLSSLVYLISLSINLEYVEEFTVEANPESLSDRMVKDLYALGVNRFSLGAQSFNDAELKAFNRAHTSVDIEAAVKTFGDRDVSFSLDLICGAPGQTMESWAQSVEKALSLHPNHISIYPLTVEEGTPLAAKVEAGEWQGPDEDLQADMMEWAQELLEEAGLYRYEVASYAKPGYEAKHNWTYWHGVEYLGLGAAAASMLSAQSWKACIEAGLFGEAVDETGDVATGPDARVRVQACPNSGSYSSLGGTPNVELELLSTRKALLEDVMLAFRCKAGLPPDLARRACETVPELGDVLRSLQAVGLVEVSRGGAQVPTERGWLMGNEIFGAIWGLA